MSAQSTAPSGYATYPSLRGRTAFVSGGASGLGAEFVTQLASQGAAVAFGDVEEARGRALEASLQDQGTEAVFLECDVRDVPALQTTLAEVAQRLGPITVLV